MTTYTVSTATTGPVEISLESSGTGPAVLLLHGGAGPQSVSAFGELLAAAADRQVLVPTHPGFGGTPRTEGLSSIRRLAAVYVALLDELGLDDVTVVGNSIGGWVAAEIALLASPRVGRVVLVDAVGLAVPSVSMPDFFSLTMDQVADLAYADPDAFRIDVDALPPAARAAMAGNRAALAVYAGSPMVDESLLGRLPAVAVPTLVVWGPADRIAPVAVGEAYAAAIPGARLALVAGAGHLPQLEQPAALATLIREFAG